MKLPAIFLCSLLFLPQAQAYCFNYAAAKYNQNPLVVESIAIWESSLRPDAVGRNYDKAGRLLSSDYCLMQINTANVRALVSIGVISSADDLLKDPCLCVQAGAWVLAKHLRKCGNTWRCLGSYNAGFSDDPKQERKRQTYAAEIRSIYERLYARQHRAS